MHACCVARAGEPGEATLVRAVRPHEQAELGELTVRVYRELLGAGMGSYADVLRDVAGRLAASCEVLVAVKGRRLQGGVTYVPGPGPYAELAGEHEAEMRMLVVHPSQQRRGVGEALVRACVERAAGQGRQALSLYTTASMVAAQRLYARMGFARDPARDCTVGAGLRLLYYSLELAPPSG